MGERGGQMGRKSWQEEQQKREIMPCGDTGEAGGRRTGVRSVREVTGRACSVVESSVFSRLNGALIVSFIVSSSTSYRLRFSLSLLSSLLKVISILFCVLKDSIIVCINSLEKSGCLRNRFCIQE